MISCTEFIPAYSEGFRFLENKGGFKEVREFWNYLAGRYLEESLRKHVTEMGLRGCYIYWKRALSEEAADFRMTLDEEKGEFRIEMRRCPSKGMLIETDYMEPYDKYCLHCPALYSRVLEPLGYEYTMDLSETDEAKCSVLVKKKDLEE
ncbi:MAG: hypothetical protein JW903_01925, partial [Clostridia bacterium]|nr:hypothetical protein [Clostridia bacterium]